MSTMSGTRNTIIMILFMTLMMGIILSGVFTWQAMGFAPGFIATWVSRFLSTYVIVLPTVLLVAPVAQRFTASIARLLDSPHTPPAPDTTQIALAPPGPTTPPGTGAMGSGPGFPGCRRM
jgi:hypothetical protein